MKITKQEIYHVGAERLEGEVSDTQEIVPSDRTYGLLKEASGKLAVIYVKEDRNFRENDTQKDSAYLRFARTTTAWNLQHGGIGELFEQRYFSRNNSKDQELSMIEGDSFSQEILLVLKKGNTYEFDIIDPFRVTQATIKIQV